MFKIVIGFMFGMNLLTLLLVFAVLGVVADYRRELNAVGDMVVEETDRALENTAEIHEKEIEVLERLAESFEVQNELLKAQIEN